MQTHQMLSTAPTATQVVTALATVLVERQRLVRTVSGRTAVRATEPGRLQARLHALGEQHAVLLAQLAVLLPPDQPPLGQAASASLVVA